MKILSGLNLQEIEQITDELGASKFRARQIHNWIYLKSVNSIDEMTDLSVKFREELKKIAVVSDTKIKVKQESSDGTLKYLLEFPDGECIGVGTLLWIHWNHGLVSDRDGCGTFAA